MFGAWGQGGQGKTEPFSSIFILQSDGGGPNLALMSATAQRLEDLPKRTQIMDAAAALFIAQGYGAVSMDAIAKAAAVSKATLYAYFRSKDALFATIIREACESNLAFRPLKRMALIRALLCWNWAGRCCGSCSRTGRWRSTGW